MSTSSGSDASIADRVAARSRHEQHRYAGDAERPLGTYLVIAVGYTAAVLAGATVVKRSDRRLPDRFDARDLALVTVATHKLARLLTKDPITSPIRAPFTTFEGTGGPSELHEEVRGRGVRHAVGELVTCPFCAEQWIATTAMFGLVLAPRTTRFIASTFAVIAGSDFLQFAYAGAQQRVS